MKVVNFALIGPGAVGKTLARGMIKQGYRLLSVIGEESPSSRRFARELGANWSTAPGQVTAVAELILIAVPDSAIKQVAKQLARQNLPYEKIAVLHTSGATGKEALAPLEKLGAAVGACHPFQTFPPRGRPPALSGITFGIDGNEKGLNAARKLTRALGGKPLVISGQQRVLYHLAAVLSCGQIAASLLMAQQVLCSLGLSERRALEAILPISTETLSNIKELGVRAALTGPAVRGDTITIRRHLRELKKLDPALAKVYREFSNWVLDKG
jgi:predicted short-subunit dehydrogenase-like oxidoreductase (DUF2520 family)